MLSNKMRHFLGVVRKVNRPLAHRTTSTTTAQEEDTDLVGLDMNEEEQLMREEEIEGQRNKSRLLPHHLRILHGQLPYDQPVADFHHTKKYKAAMFGRYGRESQVDPGTLWPDTGDIEEILEYERVAYPYTIQQMAEKAMERRKREEEAIAARQLKIKQNLQNVDKWKKEIADKVAKKNAELAAAKAKKDALIEEVRRHFGFKVDPKDDRFKEMLLQKEKEQKKKLKAERIKVKQDKLMATLVKVHSQ